MNNYIPDGVWPTMVTPFTKSDKIDYYILEDMIEWYLKNEVAGLFAVCQSSEMFFLSIAERVALAKFISKKVNGRIPVIASGHISGHISDQIEELKAMANTGVDAVVLVTNRLALEGESDEIWKRNIEIILEELNKSIPLGFYECPYPYKRLVSSKLLKWCADTERFLFLKDTSCNLKQIKDKLKAVEGSGLKIFNANSATLLESLKYGIAGYSGVMANFHPDLYVWLTRNWQFEPKKAEELIYFLGSGSVIEQQFYPVNAKYNLQLEGLNINLQSRFQNASEFTESQKKEIKQLHSLSKLYSKKHPL